MPSPPPDRDAFSGLVERLGGLPMPTLGGKQLWADVFLLGDFRIQQHAITGMHRLLAPGDIRLAVGSFQRCRDELSRLQARNRLGPRASHMVLMLHGIFRSKDGFGPMVRAFRHTGYEAHAINYPSTRRSLAEHADQVELLLDRLAGIETLSLVTHSMGGIVARVLLSRPDAAWRERIGVNRLLMIGTPNRGAEVVTLLHRVRGFPTLAGPAFSELKPRYADQIPLPSVPCGLIAGGRGDVRGYDPLIPGDDDMTVSVDSVMIDGAEDSMVVNAVHTLIIVHPTVIRAAISYIGTGSLG